MNSINILWQSKVPVLYESFKKGTLDKSVNGGNTYDFHAITALSAEFNINMDEKTVMRKNENIFNYWRRLSGMDTEADIVIKEPYPVVFGKKNRKGKTVAMIHHIDDELQKKSLKHRLYYRALKRKLPKMDLVITVSRYWEAYLKNLGCPHVKVIYNSFNPEQYKIPEAALMGFRKKYGFDDRPIIYIGVAHRQKGVYEVYKALQNSGYQLVMSGPQNYAGDLPVKFLNLAHHELIVLLHAAGLVISFSKMTEGWNRLAHESLLCRTPVIGSGVGGMRELLENAGQKIISDAALLPQAVEEVLNEKKLIGEKGYAFVSLFDEEYFKNEWIATIQEIADYK